MKNPEKNKGSADDSLRGYARSAGASVDVKAAIAEALLVATGKNFTGAGGSFVPSNLFSLKFDSPKLNLNVEQMRIFLRNLALMFNAGTGACIVNEIAPDPSQSIDAVCRLVSLWQGQSEV